MMMNQAKSPHISSNGRSEVAESVELYQLLVNSIQDYAIFLIDAEGYITTWNIGAQKLKGYDAKEIIGRNFSIFYSNKDRQAQKPENELRDCRLLGHLEDEGWRVKKDGSRFWANVVITALYDKNGNHIGFAKITRDLTERKQHEDELRLANKQLSAQHIKLSAINDSKDEFISLASHQLRTPASGVKQYLGLLLDGYAGELTEKQKLYLMRANESNNRQISLVNDLLRVAQVDAGKVILAKSLVDPETLIRDVVREQRNAFKSRQQNLKLSISKGLAEISVDPLRFRMVLENIFDNAGKYTPENGIIMVRAREDNSCMRIAISDTGVGIDDESMAKLFNKFSRIHNERSDEVGGSGLGLYWAYQIIQLHGGDITVESARGKGSTFEIIIPKESGCG